MFNIIKIEKNFFLSLLSFATSLNSTLDISKYFCLSIRNIKYKHRSKRSKRIKLFSRVLIIVDRYKCNSNNEKKRYLQRVSTSALISSNNYLITRQENTLYYFYTRSKLLIIYKALSI
jgi:hypothetical protein